MPGERRLRGLPRARGDEGRPPLRPAAEPAHAAGDAAGQVNITDPDSPNVKTPRGRVQSYNAQAVCNENQIVVAAELNVDSPDFGHLGPMVAAAEHELRSAGVAKAPEVVLADAG